MRFWIKMLCAVLVLGGIAGGASYVTWRILQKRYAPPSALKVRVEPVLRGGLSETISAPGVLQPKRNVKISAKITARIVEMPVEEGDKVIAGDPAADPPVPATVLLRLDDRDLRSRLRAARANRDALIAQLAVEKSTIDSQKADLAGLEAANRQLTRDYERKRALVASKDIPQASLDEVKSRWEQEKARLESAGLRVAAATHNLDVLRHRVEAADADIEQAEEALEYTVIRAPIDGTVTALNAEVGEMVVTGTMNNAGTVILEVADLDSMIVVAEVDESDVGKVSPGQEAVIHVEAYPDSAMMGTVATIALKQRGSSRGTKYYRTEIRLDSAGVRLYSGLTANVDITVKRHEDVLTVPSQAILGRKLESLPRSVREESAFVDTDKTFATVVYGVVEGKSVVMPVAIGSADMTRTIITGGVSEGSEVIVGPYKVLPTLSHDRAVEREEPAPAPVADDGAVGG